MTEAYRFSPTRPELPRQLFHRCGTSQGDGRLRTKPRNGASWRAGVGRVKKEAVFSILLILEDFWFRVRRLRIDLRLRITLIKHQHIPYRYDPDNLAGLGYSKMPYT